MTPRVLLPTGYTMDFNMPRRAGGVEIVRAPFIGRQRRIWRPTQAIALWRPGSRCDVVHTFNTIPLTRRPWLVTFESLLPRTIGRHEAQLRVLLRRRLLRPNCVRIVAMSEFAQRELKWQCGDWPRGEAALSKCEVLLPNVWPATERPLLLSRR